MKNNGLLLLCLLFIPLMPYAAAPSWHVSPNVCVTKELGDPCNLQIEILIDDVPPGEYCLYQDTSLVNCFSSSMEKQNIALTFSQNMQLKLVNQTGDTILSKPITVKGRAAPEGRRRVRQPWSIF